MAAVVATHAWTKLHNSLQNLASESGLWICGGSNGGLQHMMNIKFVLI